MRTHYQRDGVRRTGPTVGVRNGRTPSEVRRNVREAWREAERRLDAILGRVERGETPHLAAERRTVRDAVETWLAIVRIAKGTTHPTYQAYETCVRRHILPYAIAHRVLPDLGDGDLVAWLGDLERASVSAYGRGYALDRLRQALKRGSRGYQLENVKAVVHDAVAIRPRHVPVETDPFTPAEITRLVDAARAHPDINGVPIGLIAAVCLYAKARIGEACGLRVRDVGLFDDTLTIAQQVRHGTRTIAEVKGKRAATLPVDHDLIERLKPYTLGKDPGDLLFVWATATRPEDRTITYSLASKAFAVLCAHADIANRFATHRLKHTSGLLSVRAGTPLSVLQRQFRHRDIRTTMVYVDHADDELARRDATAIGHQLRPSS